MIYRLMIFLVLCSIASAATAIGCLVGGSSASNLNAGWFDSDLIAVADTFAANGASINDNAGGAVTDSGSATVKITDNGQFPGTQAGMFIRADFVGAHADGRYEILNTDSESFVILDLAYISDENVNNWNVGGAIPIIDGTFELQDVLDDPTFGTAATRNVDIFITGTGTLTGTLDLDVGGGITTTRKSLIGVNTSYIDDGTQATINTTSNLANGLFQFATEDYFVFKNIIFDGGGKDAGRAVYCVNAAGTGDGLGSLFENCRFTGASSNGINLRSNQTKIINCEIDLNGGHGIHSNSSTANWVISFNSVHDNDQHGMNIRASNTLCERNIIYDNGKDAGTFHGINESGSVLYTSYDGNTIFGNDNGSGFSINASSTDLRFVNNTSVENGAYGFDLNGSIPGYFAYNHASVNTTAHTDAVADGAFAAFRQGNNVNGSQAAANIFVSVADGSENFTPKAGSDLIDAGTDVQSTPTIDIGSIQLDAAGGGRTPGIGKGIGG